MKSGFTTGTCAQAAAKGASLMLTKRRLIKTVNVTIPSGKSVTLKLVNQKMGSDFARCAVIKDAGDDPDVTHGAKICAEVRFQANKGVTIQGGKGVGRVTKPGLAVGVGEWAINPVPRKMIIKETHPFLPVDKGLKVIISVPKGEELAKQTFNPRLGIKGGISIIGTTGIVEPKSSKAYKASLSLQLDVLKAAGHKKAVLVLGYVGEKFAKDILGFQEDSIIKIGDHIGFMLKESLKKKINDVILIGHIGKMVKIVKGQFNTHSRYGDNRIDVIVDSAKALGAKKEIIRELMNQATAESTIDILRKNNLSMAFNRITKKIIARINKFLGRKLSVRCILLSLNGELLAEPFPPSRWEGGKIYRCLKSA